MALVNHQEISRARLIGKRDQTLLLKLPAVNQILDFVESNI